MVNDYRGRGEFLTPVRTMSEQLTNHRNQTPNCWYLSWKPQNQFKIVDFCCGLLVGRNFNSVSRVTNSSFSSSQTTVYRKRSFYYPSASRWRGVQVSRVGVTYSQGSATVF